MPISTCGMIIRERHVDSVPYMFSTFRYLRHLTHVMGFSLAALPDASCDFLLICWILNCKLRMVLLAASSDACDYCTYPYPRGAYWHSYMLRHLMHNMMQVLFWASFSTCTLTVWSSIFLFPLPLVVSSPQYYSPLSRCCVPIVILLYPPPHCVPIVMLLHPPPPSPPHSPLALGPYLSTYKEYFS